MKFPLPSVPDARRTSTAPTEASTELRRQKAILKTGALQNAILSSANFSSIATDEKGVIQIFNVGAERMLGYAATDVINKITPADISDPAEVIARAQALSAELGTAILPGFEALVFKASRGIEDIYELTYIRKDGSRFPAVVSVTALRDAQGAILGYLLIGTDNTLRKQAEEKGRRFFELSQDMLCIIGFDGYFKELNPAWEKTLGYTQAELLARPFIEFVHPDDRPATLAVDANNMTTGDDLHDFTNRYRCKDGTYRNIQWSVTPVIRERLIFGAARDVTERKRAEEALRKAGALQSAIFNSANFSSIATDAKGVIQIFNVGAERMLGYAAADVLNQITPADISDPQEIIERARALSAELKTTITPGFEALVFKASRGIEDIYELTYIRKDGSRFPAVVSVTALRDDDGQIIGYLLIGTDNTARNQIKHALQESEERYTTLFNTMLEGFALIEVLFDAAGKAVDYRFLETNQAFEKQTGMVNAKGRRMRELAPGHEEHWFEVYGRVALTGEPIHFVNEAKALNRWFEVSAQRFGDESARRVSIFFQDITARKLAEEALRKAGALQSAIFNSANFSSIATDEKGVIQIFNVGAERMLGYAAADVLNQITPADISDPQEIIERARALSAELKTTITPGFEALVFKASRGIEDIYELTYIRKDGSRFPAVVSVTALRDDDGQIIGYLLIGTDNTARREVEEERLKLDQRLRDQQFYTRSLIESNIDALMTTDPLGIITDVNHQMETLTGCTRDELIGAPFKNCFTDPVRASAGIRQVLNERTVTDYELTARARDGRETVVSYNASTFYDRDRKLQGVFAAARDITERKAAELLVSTSTLQLQEANKELQAFSYSVSHDLRAPLRHVLGFVDLLQKDAGPTLAPKNVRYLATITAAAKRMGILIDDLLAFSRIGRAELQKSEVSLELLVRETLQDFAAETKERGIAWDIAALPPVRADRSLLRMVLVNLMANAVKFTAGRAQARIEIGQSPNGTTEDVFFIRDNGAGFDPQYTAKLFGVFQRLHSQEEFEGTGIGLANVQRIILRHGGRTWAEGVLDGGATFYFSIPKSKES